MADITARTFPNSRPTSGREWGRAEWIAHEQKRADLFNRAEGHLPGYDCPKCRNRGSYATVDENGSLHHRQCSCMSIREAQDAMKRSGLPETVLQDCTFDRWQTPENWQATALQKAKEYYYQALSDPGFPAWFVMSGRPGSGKTRLCSTLFRAMVEKGKRGRYLSWRDFARQAKSTANDGERFAALTAQAKKPPLVYIDDFWKGQITPADVHLAFEIINDRYASGKLTILSSELTLEAILRGDEAIGSRLYERSKGYYVDCSRAKNWRTGGNAS